MTTTITQSMPTFSGDAPDKDTMTRVEFYTAADIMMAWLVSFAAVINTWASQVNAVAAEMNAEHVDSQAAAAAANFAGAWSGLTGSLSKYSSVLHDGFYWMLLVDLADVTASEPADDNSDWALLFGPQKIYNHTSAHTITSAEARYGAAVFTNSGATGDMAYTLPDRDADFHMRFCVEAAYYLKISPPSGEKIYGLDDAETAADGYVRSNVVGTYCEIYGSADIPYRVLTVRGNLLVDE